MDQLTFNFDELFAPEPAKKETSKPAKKKAVKQTSTGKGGYNVEATTVSFATFPRMVDGVQKGRELRVLITPEGNTHSIPHIQFDNTDADIRSTAIRALQTADIIPEPEDLCSAITQYNPSEGTFRHIFYAVVRMDAAQIHHQKHPDHWYTLQELSTLQLSESDTLAIQQALSRIVEDVLLTPISFRMVPEQFSMIMLRETYDALLCHRYPDLVQDPGNFSREFRRMKKAAFVYEVGMDKIDPANPHRPAHLYKFDAGRYWQLHESNRRIHIFDFRV